MVFVLVNLLDVQIDGSILSLLLVALASGITGMALGLFFSSFAKNEFQAVQFMPAFVLPQFLMFGLFKPRAQMADGLNFISNLMPLSHIVDAMKSVQTSSSWTNDLTMDLLILAGITILSLVAGAVSLKTD